MIGPDTPKHVDENIGGIGWELSNEELRQLDEASTWAIDTGQIL